MLQAVADLYRAAFTGLVLATVARRGTAPAAELVFTVFRRQQQERFLPGLRKLGLDGLPDAVAAARYHYLSNRIGGVSVEYMEEGPRKAWIRYRPPRWLWWGTAVCGIPGEVSRAMLRGWHAHNGISLGNPRLGFVCTQQVADGQPSLEGYYLEHDRPLEPEERLRFARGELGPRFDPAQAPWVPSLEWPEQRLRKAHRNYAMEYLRTALPAAVDLFGPMEGGALAALALRQVGMQFHHELAEAARISSSEPAAALDLLRAVFEAQGDVVEMRGGDLVQHGWALMRASAPVAPAVFHAWKALFEGIVAAHDPRLGLSVRRGAESNRDTTVWTLHEGIEPGQA
ncbi:MAG: hypothetical protein K2X74_13250 [Acetobacteraceae bacterium]|nr:hypothetical protein [Acetobacteraceae bacterium]